jgi:phosphoribosylpyrophosphate synthetase
MPDRSGLPVLVGLPGFEHILDPARIPADHGELRVERFANGDLHMLLTSPVSGRTCLLVGSAAPPESNLAELLLAADTLKRNGAAHVRAVVPYLAYARQDRPQAGASLACAWLEKTRTARGISHRGLHGEIGKHCIVLDDFPDSGATLLSCCTELRRRDAESIDIAVTHGLFIGSRWRALFDLTRSIQVTDTVPEPRRRAHAPVRVHSVAPLLEAACGAMAAATHR